MSEELHIGELVLIPRVSRLGAAGYNVYLDGQVHQVEQVSLRDGTLHFRYAGQRYLFHAKTSAREVQVADGSALHRFQRREPGLAADAAGSGGALTSQMPGKVLKLLCQPGQRVERGAPLLILEAMKMEHEICAPSAGVVQGYPHAEGARVMPGDLLAEFTAAAG